MPYYDYGGELDVGGTVRPMLTDLGGTTSTTQTFSYSLTGVDPECSSGAGDAANSCGVHIHSGTTCTDNAGGHYYTGAITDDPWTSIAYTSSLTTFETRTYAVAFGTISVDTGGAAIDIAGRAFIVHAHDGSRIGCAILGAVEQGSLMAEGFVPYFSYSGDLAVSGTVGVKTRMTQDRQMIAYNLGGLDPACSGGAGEAANSCGVHIHEGTTCTEDAGGHYFIPGAPVADAGADDDADADDDDGADDAAAGGDPWVAVTYTSMEDGTAGGSFNVVTGASWSDLAGRALIVHAFDGSRIGCALLAYAGSTPLPTVALNRGTGPKSRHSVGIVFCGFVVAVAAACVLVGLKQKKAEKLAIANGQIEVNKVKPPEKNRFSDEEEGKPPPEELAKAEIKAAKKKATAEKQKKKKKKEEEADLEQVSVTTSE